MESVLGDREPDSPAPARVVGPAGDDGQLVPTPSSTWQAAGAGAASAAPLVIEPPPITALQPAPVHPRPLEAEEWAELLRSIGIVLGPRLVEAVAIIRAGLLNYSEACRAHNRSSGSYAALEGGSRLRHTVDYGTVRWRHEEYYLTPLQAKVVRVLHAEQRKGFRELRGSAILKEIDTYSRSFSDLFKGSPAWKTLVLPGSKRGSYRLVV